MAGSASTFCIVSEEGVDWIQDASVQAFVVVGVLRLHPNEVGNRLDIQLRNSSHLIAHDLGEDVGWVIEPDETFVLYRLFVIAVFAAQA